MVDTMIRLFISLVLINIFNYAATAEEEVGAKQLLQFLNEHKNPAGVLHNSYGYPVTYKEANLGINRDSNLLLNHYIYESMSSFSLERIPPRAMHANGCAVRGYFKVTHDVSKVMNVKAFNTIGKKTPVIVRFSSASGDIGAAEVGARGKGFAIKLYTEEGNLDIVGLHTNALFFKSPEVAISLVHCSRANPRTGIQDPTMLWDFIAGHPESLHGLIQTLSPAGQPNSYRNMAGFAIHTYQVENKKGEVSFIKLNWYPDSGIHNLTNAELSTLAGTRPDYLTEELYDSISNGTYPSWTLYMQVLRKKDMKKVSLSESDIFDVTMNWPEDEFPNKPIGKLVLNQHVQNHIAESEHSAYNPGNLVPGIRGIDKIFEARIFAYRDSHIHRLGTGFNKIEVNRPINKPLTYNRDGNPPVGDNGGDTPNYYPNSFNGIVPVNKTLSPLYRPHVSPKANNFKQIVNFLKKLSDADRQATFGTVGFSLATAPKVVQDKVLKIIAEVDKDFLNSVKAVMATRTNN